MAGVEPGSALDRWYRRTPEELAAVRARKQEAGYQAFFGRPMHEHGLSHGLVGMSGLARRSASPSETTAIAERSSERRLPVLLPYEMPWQIGASIGTFWRRRNDSKDANWKGGDKYFHCMANCESAAMGPVGEAMSGVLSDAREAFDPKNRKDGGADAAADHRANRIGRAAGVAHPERPCRESCASLRPKGLPDDY